MIRRLLRAFDVADWKRGNALVILWAYGYQLCVWPALSWFCATLNAYGVVVPLPFLLPWELLAAGSLNLAMIGGLQTVRDRWTSPDPTPTPPPTQ